MKWVMTKRMFKAGLQGFTRNIFVTIASILVMTVTLFVLGMLIFTGVILNSTLTELKDKVDMSVYFTTDAQEQDILAIQEKLEARPEVASVSYMTREEALAAFRERHQNDQLTLQSLEELGENPLGAVLSVKAKDTSQYEAIASFLEEGGALTPGELSQIDKVNFFEERQRTAIDRLTRITDSAQQLGFAIIVILALTTVAISFNTVRLAIYTSREEIAVMRLVGAGQLYIRAPFVVEGTFYGLVAGVITLILFYPLTYWLGSATENFFGGVNVFSYYLSNFPLLFLIIMGSGVGLGAISSFLAVRRYLRI